MLYMIYSTDVENSLEARKSARPAHLARLQELDEQNRLFTAGPLPAIDSEDPAEAGFTGSLVVAEFESLEAAREAKWYGEEQPKYPNDEANRAKNRRVELAIYANDDMIADAKEGKM